MGCNEYLNFDETNAHMYERPGWNGWDIYFSCVNKALSIFAFF